MGFAGISGSGFSPIASVAATPQFSGSYSIRADLGVDSSDSTRLYGNAGGFGSACALTPNAAGMLWSESAVTIVDCASPVYGVVYAGTFPYYTQFIDYAEPPFTDARTFRFWFNKPTKCAANFNIPSFAVNVINLGATSIIVNGTTIAPAGSIAFNAVVNDPLDPVWSAAYQGYGTGDLQNYSGGFVVRVS